MLVPSSFWARQEYFPDTLASPITRVLTIYMGPITQLWIIQSGNKSDCKCSTSKLIPLWLSVWFICGVLITIRVLVLVNRRVRGLDQAWSVWNPPVRHINDRIHLEFKTHWVSLRPALLVQCWGSMSISWRALPMSHLILSPHQYNIFNGFNRQNNRWDLGEGQTAWGSV